MELFKISEAAVKSGATANQITYMIEKGWIDPLRDSSKPGAYNHLFTSLHIKQIKDLLKKKEGLRYKI